MPKPPTNWPPGALPARMDVKQAAFYLAIGETTFLDEVKAGRYPKPQRERGRVVWLTSALLAAVDKRASTAQPQAVEGSPQTDEDWLAKVDNADENRRHKAG